ncbi:MAG: PH domain-containing protein [Sphingomicrobium sp.]
MAAGRATGAPEKLHWSSLLSTLRKSIRGLWGLFAGGAYLAVQGHWAVVVGLAILFAFVSVAAAVLRWTRFTFAITDDQVRIDSGIVSRTHRSIPFDRIQDVDITQGPVARLLGVARVKFETGGGAAGTDDGVLDAIALDRAETLRSLIRSRGAEIPASFDELPVEVAPIYSMSLQRLFLAGMFNFSLALFAFLFGATQTMGDAVGFDPFNRRFWQGLLATGSPIAAFLLAHQVAAAVAGLLILGLAGLATGVIRTVLRDFGFRVDRTETGLRRRRGLLTRTDVTLPVARVQAAVIATGPVRDRFGWRALSLQNLARDEGEKNGHLLAPLASDPEVDRILTELGWRDQSSDAQWRPVSACYVWLHLILLTPLFLIAVFQAFFFPLFGLIGCGFIAGAALTRFLAWRRTRYALDGDRLLVRTGWWRRRSAILPLSKVQSIDLTENVISRWFGTASLQFGVAGGAPFGIHGLPALGRETARNLRDKLLAGER